MSNDAAVTSIRTRIKLSAFWAERHLSNASFYSQRGIEHRAEHERYIAAMYAQEATDLAQQLTAQPA